MKIAVASGKGGTGKTMVATSLAASLSPEYSILILDCDVEAPNAHLYLKPEFTYQEPAVIPVPVIDQEKCILCGKCCEECEFHALAMLQEKVLLFAQLCHGCGSCSLVCPVEAIAEQPREIGQISHGENASGIQHLMGELSISEPMPTPIIRQLKKQTRHDALLTILDSPPGASCSAVATVHDADFIILVTEPTPFGLHDLQQMMGIIKKTEIPAGIIINRSNIGDQKVEEYLRDSPYPILMKIPFQTDIAYGLASGKMLIEILPEYRRKFQVMLKKIGIPIETLGAK